MEEERSFGTSPLVAADKVQGRNVFNRQGDKLGSIKDIYLDKISGQVMFVTLAHGGVLGAGAKVHPLPWEVLDYKPDRHGFMVDLDKQALESSPAYNINELDENTGWGAKVRDFYKLTPMERYGGAPPV